MDKKIIFPQTVGEALLLLQKRAKITAKELAMESGLSYTSLWDILNDVRSPKLEDLIKIIEVLSNALNEPSPKILGELGEVARHQKTKEGLDFQAELG